MEDWAGIRRQLARLTPGRSGLALLMAVVLLSLLVMAGWIVTEHLVRQQSLGQVQSRLFALSMSRGNDLGRSLQDYRGDLRFFAQTPSISEFIRARSTTPSEAAPSLARLQTLYSAYLRTHDEVTQIRVVSAEASSMELVRVDRTAVGVQIPPVEQLQAKGDRDDVQAALRLPAGQVYLSDLNLNREFGRVQVPHVPTLRVSTPLRGDDGKLFGVLVMNLAAQAFLDPLIDQPQSDVAAYLTNAQGDFLLHPDPDKRFGFDLGQRHRWQDEFSPGAMRLAPDLAPHFSKYASPYGTGYVMQRRLRLDESDPARDLILSYAVSDAAITERLHAERWLLLLVVVGIVLIMSALLLSVVLTQRRSSLQHAQLAAIVSSSNDAIIGMDLSGRVMQWNRAAEKLFGYPAAEVIGSKIVDLIVPAERADEELLILKRVSMGQVVPHFDSVRRRRDGSQMDVSLTVSPMRTADGHIIGAAKILRDISEQKQAERDIVQMNLDLEAKVEERSRHIRRLSERLTIAAESVGLGVWEWDLKTGELIWNEQMFRIYEIDPEVSSGRYDMWRDRLHPQDRESTEALLQAAVAGTADYNPAFRIYTSKGEMRYISAVALVVRDAAGVALRMVGVNRDITDEHRAQQALKDARDDAEKANRAKSQFLANMSHEIRTPMNAVLGMLQLLGRSALSFNQADYVSKAETAAGTLLGILNDILDFSKVEAGRLSLDPRPFVLDLLLRDVGVILSSSLGHKPIELLFDVGPGLGRPMIGDDLRIKQVLINLGGNAVKFTEAGEVTIRLRLLDEREGRLSLEFQVCDTGITAEQQLRIFEGFSQAEASTTRRFGGTGLGLAISQRLVRLMGGDLSLQSAAGQGSEFSFSLELELDSGHELITAPMAEDLHGLHVLIVDDNEHARNLLGACAESFGWRAELASEGAGAVRRFAEVVNTPDAFDVVLIDWQMPVMDGRTTAQRIRDISNRRSSTLILTTTALGREELIRQADPGGGPQDGYLVKPITASMFFDAVADARAGHTQQRRPKDSPRISERRLAGLRLLVVEDNLVNQQVARELLSAEGAEVAVAACGLEGVDQVLRSQQVFDAVLMDVQMPDIDGLQATALIRADPSKARLPIIAMTANAMAEDRAACLAAGMNEHVGKPFHVDSLVSVLLRHTSRHSPAVETTPLSLGDQAMAIEAALERLGNHRELLARQMQSFCDTQADALLQVRSLIASAERERAQARLHSLKGVAATLGAVGLAAAAAVLEQGLKQQCSGDELESGLIRAEHQMQNALHAFADFVAEGPVARVLQPLSDAELIERLDRLDPLLQQNSLTALDVLDALRGGVPDRLLVHLQALSAAMERLDFAAALVSSGELRRVIG